MKPPPGYEHPSNKVCCLGQALHGLKQAPRACSLSLAPPSFVLVFTPVLMTMLSLFTI